MSKLNPKGIYIRLKIESPYSDGFYQITRYSLRKFQFGNKLIISSKGDEYIFRDYFSWVHPTADEIREILSEEHPFRRYQIARRIFDRYSFEVNSG